MKVGVRKPSIKKSVKSRTTGRVKRAAKRSVNPVYGKKGAGFAKNPSRSVKNAVYHRTTIGVGDILDDMSSEDYSSSSRSFWYQQPPAAIFYLLIALCSVLLVMGVIMLLINPIVGLIVIVCSVLGIIYSRNNLKKIREEKE